MPTELKINAFSSMTSILGSINNDRHVYRWFLILISVPGIQQKLSEKQKPKEGYQILKKLQIAEIITYIVSALILTGSCLIKQPWVLLGEGVALVVLMNLFRMNRECVAAISEEFLLESIPSEELERQTLYQTCEYLSRKYNIPSLVDIITFQDFIGRKVLLATILILPFICSFKLWQQWILIIIVFLTTVAITNISFVLRRLK